MRIESLELKNYRCFHSLSMDFHPQMTVLVAPNGQGKTAILDAIKVALWPFVAGFDLGGVTNARTGIAIDDVRREQIQEHQMEWRLPSEIKAEGHIHVPSLMGEGISMVERVMSYIGSGNVSDIEAFSTGLPWTAHRFRESVKKSSKTKSRKADGTLELNSTAIALQQQVFSDTGSAQYDLPMLGYYGTGRLWVRKKQTLSKASPKGATSRTFAYRDCMDPASDYKNFALWFARIHKAYFQAMIRNVERQLPVHADVPYALIAPFKAIQSALIETLKPQVGWSLLEYSAEQDDLVLNHDQHGELKVSQLSDGIRNMLALVGDIAYRCYTLNAHLGQSAPKKARGIVLIDEIDMHLHPVWQQTVMQSLHTAFPEIQFIVTTHSPQVLTSVDSNCIRVIREATDSETGRRRLSVDRVPLQTKGVTSTDLLIQVMGVNPVPPNEEARWIADYTAKIESGSHEDAEGVDLREKLLDFYGPRHPVMLDADRLIRFQAFKLRRAESGFD